MSRTACPYWPNFAPTRCTPRETLTNDGTQQAQKDRHNKKFSQSQIYFLLFLQAQKDRRNKAFIRGTFHYFAVLFFYRLRVFSALLARVCPLFFLVHVFRTHSWHMFALLFLFVDGLLGAKRAPCRSTMGG